MNERDAYCPKLEEILISLEPKIDYSTVFDDIMAYQMEELYSIDKPSFRQFLPNPHMVIPKPGTFQYRIYQNWIAKRLKIKRLSEAKTLKLLKNIFPNIYKIEHPDYPPNKYPIDFYEPDFNLHFEHKKRYRSEFPDWERGMTIGIKKYTFMMENAENPYYINSTPRGLFAWNLKLLDNLEWEFTDKTPKTTYYDHEETGETIETHITYLPFEKSNDLTYLLLHYF